MTDTNADNFLTVRHKRLMWFAYIAKIMAWVMLVFQVLRVIPSFMDAQSWMPSIGLRELIRVQPAIVVNLIVSWIDFFLRGIVYWLVLKGISLGLYMIVETDLNYRETAEGGSDEQ